MDRLPLTSLAHLTKMLPRPQHRAGGNENDDNGRGGHLGRKHANGSSKPDERKDMAIGNAEIIAESMRHRNEVIEEKNALDVLYLGDCEKEEDKRADKNVFASPVKGI